MVVAIAVSGTLVIMAKMMGYTMNRGQAVDISNAVTISQMAIDNVRDQWFPPTGAYGNLTNTANSGSITLSNTLYTYAVEIVAPDGSGGTSEINVPTIEYDGPSKTDNMSGGYRNLLKVTVTVFKNGRLLLKTVTYKTRNGYY